jgi:hypothetical protein
MWLKIACGAAHCAPQYGKLPHCGVPQVYEILLEIIEIT